MERILSSPLLAQSPRLSRFLRFVVESAQRGQAEGLKEYAIGVEVFERGRDFDPRIDNIVRIQAAKLRSKLVEYYASHGAADPIVIGIPKGSYVPEIRVRATAAVEHPAPAGASARQSHIAVLPFVNLSSDPENEYFSDGLTEELINRLASNPNLHVVARTSAFQFKGQNDDLREVGAKLNVGTVLEGSVRKAGDQLRVTAQLIDVQTGFHLFSRTYQRAYTGVFELQDELAHAVASEIAPGNEIQRSLQARTSNLNAYNAYLRGMYAMANRFTDLSTCLECFREALAMDPGYAPAWAGLAQGYFMTAWFYQAAPETVMPLMKEAARKTLELDPDSALGLHTMAVAECATEWAWASAESRFRRGIALQPSLAIGYIDFAAFCLLPQDRSDEACAVLEQALSFDPFNPLLQATAIFAYGRSGRYGDAERQYALARNVGPGYAPIAATMGNSLEAEGRLEEAIQVYREACRQAQDAPYPLSCLGHALALSGRHAEAKEILQRLLDSPILPAPDIARVYAGLRDAEETLRWLELAARNKSLYLLRATGDPRFQWLEPEPRFQDFTLQLGLRPPQSAAAKASRATHPRPRAES